MSEPTVKLKSIERAGARTRATCEVPEKYVKALLDSGKWERDYSATVDPYPVVTPADGKST
jgi:hypothetical protein